MGSKYRISRRQQRTVNTLLADNAALSGPDCSGALTSQGYNLVQNAAGCSLSSAPGDMLNLDTRLQTLGMNGGSTLTHAIGYDSPAVDAGSLSACPAVDQRRVTRPQLFGCDIGAFELEPARLYLPFVIQD